MTKRVLIFIALCLATAASGWACTSILVSAKMSGTGRPLMWKHRDTGAADNFIARVNPDTQSEIGYVALFNGGDSLLQEAWMGMNDAGFAIMNTASYNLSPDTTDFKDQEGVVMAAALARCKSLADFEALLDTWPKPMGIQANFGVMDAQGSMAYYECDDVTYVKYDMADEPAGYIIRTNHSLSGNDTDGFGYVRCQNLKDILAEEFASGKLYPWDFTEKASRSFWHSLLGEDFGAKASRWAVDQDFIPRGISTASIVIEGITAGAADQDMLMWTVLGYPPASWVQLVTLQHIPADLEPSLEGWHAAANIDALQRKAQAFPLHQGNGQKYIDMDYLRSIAPQMKEKSKQSYLQYYRNQPDISIIINENVK